MVCFIGLCMPWKYWLTVVLIAILASYMIIMAGFVKDMLGDTVGNVVTFGVLTFLFVISIIVGTKLSFRDDVHIDKKKTS